MTVGDNRAARYSDLFASQHDHVSDCAYCPICTTISVVRRTKPEILEHLGTAARELAIVAAILLEEAGDMISAAESRRQSQPPPAEDAPAPAQIRRIDAG